MQKISPCLWFDDQAQEAVDFYTSLFADAKITDSIRFGETGSGASVVTITFELAGQEIIALNGGPYFTFTPAISFFVNCSSVAELDQLWHQLGVGGIALMELASYPFSERFGWIQDRYGLSWQLNLSSGPLKITPFLMFVGSQLGKAKEAISFYQSFFNDSRLLDQMSFTLNGQEFIALDSDGPHDFSFNEAFSLFVKCEDQGEVDRLWEGLSQGGEKGQCGWLKDKYGVSWQIVPTVLAKLLQDPDRDRAQRVMQTMLQMKKLDIELLQQA